MWQQKKNYREAKGLDKKSDKFSLGMRTIVSAIGPIAGGLIAGEFGVIAGALASSGFAVQDKIGEKYSG